MANPTQNLGSPSADPAAVLPLEAPSATSGKAPASAWYALVILVLATFLGTLDAALLKLLAEPVRHSLGLSDTQLGLMQGMGLTLFAGIATYPIGWIADRYDRRVVLAACVVLWSAATAARGASHSFEMMFLASMGLGIGEAGLGPIVYSLIPDLFPSKQRVLATSVYALLSLTGAGIGIALGGAIVPMLESLRPDLPLALQGLESWRLACMAVALPGPFVALLVLTMRWRVKVNPGARANVKLNASTNDGTAEHAAVAPYVGVLRYVSDHWKTLLGVVGGVGLSSMGLGALGSWLPVLAAREYGATPAQIGQGIGSAILCGTVAGATLGGLLLRHMRRHFGPAAPLRVIMLGQVAAAMLSLMLLMVRSANDIYILLGLMFTPLIATSMLSPTLMQDLSPAHLRTRMISLLTLTMLPFGAISPVLVGIASDLHGHLITAILCITFAGVTVGALVLRLTETSFTRTIVLARSMG
ncbi:MFS transporter [Undibacterium sp.]|jgi:MFS family permease|uniref:MFS transporter n=1 Tax=Undibacterium sp. TaxID=1914977 RepID=UPI002C01399C|nr:MFS transporter [Undibacterium sp.]HTD07047.1 MFS transporter [Undibacterium sp.]